MALTPIRLTPEPEGLTSPDHGTDALVVSYAEALFASSMSTGTWPTPAQVGEAILESVTRFGGLDGCIAEMAFAYGQSPGSAAVRMRWACDTVRSTYVRNETWIDLTNNASVVGCGTPIGISTGRLKALPW
jgi:hypothetical protein